MGISERKEKQKTEIRKMILDASMQLFVEQGFANVSIRKIADLIEYSPTTVYLYFKDKDDILFSLHELGFQKMAEYNEGLWDIKNPLLRLHKMGENYIKFGLANPEFYDLMFIQRSPMQTIEKMVDCEWKSGDVALGRLKDTVREGMDMGLIIKGDVDVVSMAVWSTVHGLVSLSIRNRFDKLVPPGTEIPMMNQAVNWLLESIDMTIRK
ncbi:TetR/AcrR family transcriptional regulator [Paraflavitalea speifideaquila]|uniref:TetR/AcrR family transcriptional regulator n=1 Tax=Paraflavitalea speifideaquila TaxID=3076558 RepID=UPI0028E96E4F|nr:TetR/AcrR family transcriptional regulator [Paraflavitalea speifideiaquila]